MLLKMAYKGKWIVFLIAYNWSEYYVDAIWLYFKR